MEGMAKNPALIQKKLRRLFADHPRQKLADAFGVHRQSISQYLSGAAVPGPVVLLRIARYFNVSMEWLVDDEQPVDRPASPADTLSDGDLMYEVARRYKVAAVEILRVLKGAENVDWFAVAEKLFEFGVADEPDLPELRGGLERASSPGVLLLPIESTFNLLNWLHAEHEGLPEPKPSAPIYPDQIRDRALALLRDNPGIRWVSLYENMQACWRMFPDRRERIDERSREFLEQLKKRGPLPEDMDYWSGMSEQHLAERSEGRKKWMKDRTNRSS